MRKIKIVGALIAILAFSALVVASASATLWLSSGRSLTGETPATSHGTLVFHHEGGIGSTVVTCSGLFEGSVGPEALDLITLATSLNGAEKDLVSCSLNSGFCLSPILHMLKNEPPWHTLLELVGGQTRDHFLTSEYGMLCAPNITITCPSTTAYSIFTGNGGNGAEFEYTKASTETTCNDGGKGWITGTKGTTLGFTVS